MEYLCNNISALSFIQVTFSLYPVKVDHFRSEATEDKTCKSYCPSMPVYFLLCLPGSRVCLLSHRDRYSGLTLPLDELTHDFKAEIQV